MCSGSWDLSFSTLILRHCVPHKKSSQICDGASTMEGSPPFSMICSVPGGTFSVPSPVLSPSLSDEHVHVSAALSFR